MVGGKHFGRVLCLPPKAALNAAEERRPGLWFLNMVVLGMYRERGMRYILSRFSFGEVFNMVMTSVL